MNREELADFAGNHSSRSRRMSAFLKPGRDVAILASIQILCFLVLTRLEPRFLIIHFYQLIPYVAILVLLGYGQARWAYMIGPLVSVAWFGLAYMAGFLRTAVDRLRAFGNVSLDATLVALLALVTAVVAVLMTVLCRIHWVKEYLGRGPGWQTFLISLGIVVVYYAVLLRWFWDMILNG